MTAWIFIPASLLGAALACMFSVYYLVLHRRARGLHAEEAPPHPPETLPTFHVIIPCYQEKALLPEKLENTAQLDYPKNLMRGYVVDGGSSDGSAEIAQSFCETRAAFAFFSCPGIGKVPQVNTALKRIRDGIVLVTDADGRLPRNALKQLAAHYSDARVGCVGASTTPRSALSEDQVFWQHQNAMRLLESRCGHSSVTVAAAYSFRRNLFDLFPNDVVADDVYAAFECNTQGYTTVYSRHVRAEELRCATTFGRMAKHKVRKLNANMHELIRFLPRCREMKGLWQTMFLAKFAQSWLAAPMILGVMILLAVSVRHAGPRVMLYWGGLLFALLALQVAAERVLMLYRLTDNEPQATLVVRCRYLVLSLAVLIVGFFCYVFVRHTSFYEKTG